MSVAGECAHRLEWKGAKGMMEGMTVRDRGIIICSTVRAWGRKGVVDLQMDLKWQCEERYCETNMQGDWLVKRQTGGSRERHVWKINDRRWWGWRRKEWDTCNVGRRKRDEEKCMTDTDRTGCHVRWNGQVFFQRWTSRSLGITNVWTVSLQCHKYGQICCSILNILWERNAFTLLIIPHKIPDRTEFKVII